MIPDLAALIADPNRVAEVAVDDVPALLDALAHHEGRCRLVRDLLTARLTAAPAVTPAERDWMTLPEVVAAFGVSARTVRRRMRDGTWSEGVVWFAPNGTEPRFSRAALDGWQRTMLAAEPIPAVGLAYGPDVPPGRRRRLQLLPNKSTSPGHDLAEGEKRGGAAARVSGAGSADRGT